MLRKVSSFVGLLAVMLGNSAISRAQPTFAKDVAPILQNNCQGCHRPNDIAPFALLTYEDAQTWAEDIKRVVSDKIMPPWKPVADFGEFRDVRGLTDNERMTITQWVDAGAPMGDPADLPAEKAPVGEWQMGDPDLVVQMPASYTPPRGSDTYRCFVVTNPFDQATYVQALDVVPGNRQIVHHVILFIDDNGASTRLDGKEDDPGYTCFGGPGFDISSLNFMLGGWAPGTTPHPLPDGIGVLIPKGGRLVMQVHYAPFGKTGEDQTKIGLYFSKVQVKQPLYYIPVLNQKFAIPPGNSSFEATGEQAIGPLPNVKVIQVFPHMHMLGRKIQAEFDTPGQGTTPLVFIDDWDFNWQGFYTYKAAVPIPAQSTVRVKCTWDNSDGNPKNPNNPLTTVTWGERTLDEMCIAFLGVTLN